VTAVPRLQVEPSPTICVGILATDPLRLIGLQAILEESLHLRTTLLAEGGASRSSRPNVVVVDAGAPHNVSLAESVERLRKLLPSAPVIVLARIGTPEVMEEVVSAGALGFLPETAGVEEISACIQAVLEGTPWLPEESRQVALMSKSITEPHKNLSSRFTPKEREVLQWLTQGRSNREIAATMHIDEATVKAHLGRMLRKAKATNRVELTLRVLAEGH